MVLQSGLHNATYYGAIRRNDVDFEGLQINAVYISANCSYCGSSLVDIASLRLKVGFEERFICTECLQKVFDAVLSPKSELVTANVALSIAGDVDKLREEKADVENIDALHKRIDRIEKQIGKSDISEAPDAVPEVSGKDKVRPAGKKSRWRR